MSGRLRAPEIASLVARNAVPLAGLLFFHWSAANLLILYFVDTLLAIAVIVAGFLYSASPVEEMPGFSERLATIVSYAAGAGFVTLIMAIPLGMPVLILVFGVNDASFTGMLADRGFQAGLGLQAIASLVSFRDLATALRTYTPEELGLKRRFALVFLRWVATIGAAYLPFTYLFGAYAPLVLIVVYIGVTIVAEIMPDRFIAAFGDPGAGPRPTAEPSHRRHRKR